MLLSLWKMESTAGSLDLDLLLVGYDQFVLFGLAVMVTFNHDLSYICWFLVRYIFVY